MSAIGTDPSLIWRFNLVTQKTIDTNEWKILFQNASPKVFMTAR